MTEKELNRLEALNDDGRLTVAPNIMADLIRLARVGLAVQPRPIAELPKDERALAFDKYGDISSMIRWYAGSGKWLTNAFASDTYATHGIPLSALPKLGGE